MPPVFPIVMVAAIGVVLWLSIANSRRANARLAARLAEQLGGVVTAPARDSRWGRANSSVQLEWAGLRFNLVCSTLQNVSVVQVCLETQRTLPMVVCFPRTRASRIETTLRLDRDLRVNDPDFDDAVHIVSEEAEAVVQAALGDPRLRSVVREVVAAGHVVTLSKHAVSLELRTRLGQPPAKEVLEHRLALLRDVAPSLRDVPSAIGTRQRSRGDRWAMASWLGAGLAMVAHITVNRIQSGGFEALSAEGQWTPRLFGAAFTVGLVTLAYLSMRGRSHSLLRFGVTSFSAIVLGYLIPLVVAYPLNAALDSAPVSKVMTTVVSTSVIPHAKTGPTYRVHLKLDEHRPEPQYVSFGNLRIAIPQALFETLNVGDRVELEIHRGAFGWPYRGEAKRVDAAVPAGP